jgi:transposase
MHVRVGMEATGYSRWFERLLAELGFELWIGDPAEIKAKRVKKQKFDREDARLILRLMRENNFPQIWVPGPENRDLRQLLWHRHRLVQMRTRIMNQLQALAMNEGYRWKRKLFTEQGRALLEKLSLAPWASRRRQELLELLDRMNPTIEELTAATEQEVKKRPEALRLMTHPGVGPLTELAYVLIIGTPKRFHCGKQIGTYVGMIPSEDSSARKYPSSRHPEARIDATAPIYFKTRIDVLSNHTSSGFCLVNALLARAEHHLPPFRQGKRLRPAAPAYLNSIKHHERISPFIKFPGTLAMRVVSH